MHAETLQNLRYCVELFGVMAFAFCGAFQAVRCDLGIFGVLLLSEAVALGAGSCATSFSACRPWPFTIWGSSLHPVVLPCLSSGGTVPPVIEKYWRERPLMSVMP